MSEAPQYLVDRSVTSPGKDGSTQITSLLDWRAASAYVLLGEPGSGKTTALKAEAAALGDDAKYLTTRDFLTLPLASADAEKVLFIDALDERLVASADPKGPFDSVRSKLAALPRPRFRIACREADWFAGGAKDLEVAVPGARVTELRLNQLSDDDVGNILASWTPVCLSDPAAFIAIAKTRGVEHLLRNPLLLDLLVTAVRGERWPDSREETYRLACHHLAQEQNSEHRLLAVKHASTAELLKIAGLVCASMLLSDRPDLSLEAEELAGAAVSVDALASNMSLDPALLTRCLNSKLFAAEGRHRVPRHRTIAEFLGAAALANLAVHEGVPLGRLTTLMVGYDGRVIEALRGLFAWFTVHNLRDRNLLVDRDPLALVLYGDVLSFSTQQKEHILQALFREAQTFPWFRSGDWSDHPFGALGTRDMEPGFRARLRDSARDSAHQVMLDCLMNAIRYGAPFDGLLGDLQQIVRDNSHWQMLRSAALEAWYAKPGFDGEQALRILDDIRTGKVVDVNDQLAGSLLEQLYPGHLTGEAVLTYLRPRKDPSLIGDFRMFWSFTFLQKTPTEWLPGIADRLAMRVRQKSVLDDEDEPDQRFELLREVTLKTVCSAVSVGGDNVPIKRLYAWLDACQGKYGSIEQGDEYWQIQAWLEARPTAMTELYRLAVSGGEDRIRRFGTVGSILFGAAKPRQWYQELLRLATEADTSEEAAHYVKEATEAALEDNSAFDICLDHLGAWINANHARWPEAGSWVESATSWPVDGYPGREYRRRLDAEAKNVLRRSERQRIIAPQLASISGPSANPGLLHDIVKVYRAAQGNAEANTLLEQIATFLVAGPKEASDALQGVRASLDRPDLPSVDEIFALKQSGKIYTIGNVCLLAAELRFEANSETFRSLDADALEKLVAFHLAQGQQERRAWFVDACSRRPDLVAKVLVPFMENEIRVKASPDVATIYSFRDENGPADLIKLAVPRLVAAIPDVPTESHLHVLNSILIRGGRHHLDPTLLRATLDARLQVGGDSALEISLHSGLLYFDGEAHCLSLEGLCTTQERAHYLAVALSEQHLVTEAFVSEYPGVTVRLARLLLSATPRIDVFESNEAGPTRDTSQTAERLLRQLSNMPSLEIGTQLRDLRQGAVGTTWQSLIDWCIFDQSKLARTANFETPSFGAVCRVLTNGAPASHRDLAELLRDHLAHLAERIQHQPANLLDGFYRLTPKRQIIPKIENDCRDLLLGLVEDRITQQGASIDKETHAADDKRADLQGSIVRSARMVIPIEVKKDNHREVWTAWRDQLHARYTANPEAGGIGIYLVLWFGVDTRNPPHGPKPQSAQDMASTLDAMIPIEYRQRTLGLVIDLSRQLRDK